MRYPISSAAGVLLAAALLGAPVSAATQSNGAAVYDGVDIYHGDSENGQIDWDKLAAAQDFVYIKSSEGENWVDSMYRENIAQAKAHGMAWGTYHFLRLYSVESARTQARNYWARIQGTGYTLIPAVDVESHDGQQSAAAMREIVRAFIDEFKAVSGITPVLYTYTSYANDILKGQFADCPLWLADYRGYAGDVAGWGSWNAWQYSEHGSIDAIANHEVDLNHATAGIWLDASQAGSETSTGGTAGETDTGSAAQSGSVSVRAVQQKLNRLGLSAALDVDGLSGSKTRAATRRWQAVAGLAQDGIWGQKTEAAYQSMNNTPTLRQGSRGTAVRYVQARVGAAVDGIFGVKTRAAVKKWQAANGLAADGIVGSRTWAALLGGV